MMGLTKPRDKPRGHNLFLLHKLKHRETRL